MSSGKGSSRFHGRIGAGDAPCAVAGCTEPGEFRAPLGRAANGFDGPAPYRLLCLDHVREFNQSYDYFAGMDTDGIARAQHPAAGWDSQFTARFRVYDGASAVPRWADYADPLEAISARFRDFRKNAERASPAQNQQLPAEVRAAFKTLGLTADAERTAIRKTYSALVRRYHPDRNGGDRRYERELQAVVDAYQLLRKSVS